jgi:hypothetical protein
VNISELTQGLPSNRWQQLQDRSKLIRKSDPKKEEALINPTFSTVSAQLRLSRDLPSYRRC